MHFVYVHRVGKLITMPAIRGDADATCESMNSMSAFPEWR